MVGGGLTTAILAAFCLFGCLSVTLAVGPDIQVKLGFFDCQIVCLYIYHIYMCVCNLSFHANLCTDKITLYFVCHLNFYNTCIFICDNMPFFFNFFRVTLRICAPKPAFCSLKKPVFLG